MRQIYVSCLTLGLNMCVGVKLQRQLDVCKVMHCPATDRVRAQVGARTYTHMC